MFKGSIIKKCISLVMVIAVLMGIAAPASAATAELLDDSKIGYVALGDAITGGYGLEQEETRYHQIVAEYLGYKDTYVRRFGNRWRAEELRYLLDNDYKGDGYTKKFSLLSSQRADIQDAVKNAEVVTVQIGVNNFATYFVEQLMNYLDPAKTPYEYDFDQVAKELFDFQDEFSADEITNAVATVREAVMEQLLAAAPDEGDIALEFIEYAIEVATYSLLSYVTSFNGMVNAIYELNPNVDLYVIGIYNPAAGEVLTYRTEDHVVAGELIKGREIEIPIGDAIGAVIELANSYAQILAPRAFNYTYVDPGTPIKLIDKMADKALPLDERIPVAVKNALLYASEETAVTLIQELFAEYGISKTYKEALAIAQEIVNCKTDELRDKYIRESVNGLIVEEVIKQFEKELKNYDNAYGEIKITSAEIKTLLDDLWNAETETARENVATVFVENLMKNAMVGHTIAGVYVDDVEEAQKLIDMLKGLAADTTSPAEKRKAAAIAIAEKINTELANKGLGAWTVEAAQVLTLLERLDAKEDDPATTDVDERLAIVENWLNDLAVDIIAKVMNASNDKEVKNTLHKMFTEMEEETDDSERVEIARTYLIKIVADKVANSYENNGLGAKPATEDSFESLVTKALNGQIQIRDELRAAAIRKVTTQDFYKYVSTSITEAALNSLFNAVEVPGADISACVKQWIKDYGLTNLNDGLGGFVYTSFYDACTSYVKVAEDTEAAFAEYSEALNKAPETCAQYVALKSNVAADILSAYKTSYVGIADVAQSYYTGFMNLRSQAVNKVMTGYDQYVSAVEKGMASCDALTKKFDKVFAKLAKIAEVDEICLNDILDVAKKVAHNGGSYIDSMIGNLMQGDSLMNSEMTVAYLALCYYFADGIMHLPSEEGHKIMANQVIKAIKGEPTNSTAGWLANLVIDKMIDIYHMPASASGQAKPLVNPDSYVAFGDNITLGSGTAVGTNETYVKLLAEALAMCDCEDEKHQDCCIDDVVANLSLSGMRTEELLAIVDKNYNGDAYTDARYDLTKFREQYWNLVKSGKLDLVTINVGINNLVTYPLTQTLLTYNGETPYEMDWARFMGENWANKLNKGKNAVMDLLNHVVHNDSTCETTLNTVATAVEAIAYSLIGYVVNLDCAVEEIYNANPNATIVLTEFYNPLLDTYFTTPGTITLKNVLTGGEKTVELKQYEINVSAIADSMVNLANRFLTGYIGYYKDGVVARGENSRIVTVAINDTPLDIDPSVSKDLSDLVEVITVNVMGRDIAIKVPEYLKEAVATGGVALHPNAEGHQYICDQILKALEYEITPDVLVDGADKYYGDADPEFDYHWHNFSSLFYLEDYNVTISHEDHNADNWLENVGVYDLIVTAVNKVTGETIEYNLCDLDVHYKGKLYIKARPVTVKVTVLDGEISNAVVTAGSLAPNATVDILNLALNDDKTGVTYDNPNYDVTIDVEFKSSVETDYVCELVRNGEVIGKYVIVHQAVLDAQPNDVVRMIKSSDQTALKDVYHYAGSVNLINGITLDLQGYTLTLDSLFAAEGNYVKGSTDKNNSGKLIVPAESFELHDSATFTYNKLDYKVLPVWDPSNGGYYLFANTRIDDERSVHGLSLSVDENGVPVLYFQFDISASSHIRDSLFADNGITDNRMAVEVYLQWDMKDENGEKIGVAHQTFVYTDDMVKNASGSMDCYYKLYNYDELGIDPATLTATARIVSDCGAMVYGDTWNQYGMVSDSASATKPTDPSFTFVSAPKDMPVCVNTTTWVEYSVVHEAILAAKPGETIQMIADSDQTKLIDVCPSAGMVNLLNGIKLDLHGHTLKLDSLFAAEGSYVVGSTDKTKPGRLIVPEENFVMHDAAVFTYAGLNYKVLPVWDPSNGYYLFANTRIDDERSVHGLSLSVDENGVPVLYFQFDISASSHIRDSLFADNGITDNRMAVEVYLQWDMKDENGEKIGVAHQTFVYTDDMVKNASGSMDCYYKLYNYDELGIDPDTLIVSAQIVSNSGAIVTGADHRN